MPPIASTMPACLQSNILTAALVAAGCLQPFPAAIAQEPAKDFSPAERAIFMTDQLAKLRPPTQLRYDFHRTGSLEPAFDDKVTIALKAQAGGKCCDASGEFLTGARKLALPPVEGAAGNPVTLYFLEREIREMERLTKGKAAYFRKRIRMAVYQGAQQRDVTLRYRGKAVPGQEFTITPYADDPNRGRFEQLSQKRYVFTLSDAVPGGVYAIRTVLADTAKGAAAPPLLADELLIEGGDAAIPAKTRTPS
jgi:hypothetical protein